jgi:periplasmic protein TonB
MSTLLFETLVVSSQARRAGRGRLSVPLSLGLHALGVGGLVALSLLPRVDLPAAEPPPVRGAVIFERPVRVQPTPEPMRATQPRPATDSRPSVAPPPTISAPHVVPDGLPANDLDTAPNPRAAFTDGTVCPDCDGPTGGPTVSDGASLGVIALGPPRVVVAGYDVQAPRKLRNVVPVYPDLAKRAGTEGKVVVECTIDVTGHIANARVLSGHPLLAPAALAAVSEWTYVPTRLGGVPVAVILTVTVNFSLQH